MSLKASEPFTTGAEEAPHRRKTLALNVADPKWGPKETTIRHSKVIGLNFLPGEPAGQFSRLNFDAVPGTTYYLALDGDGNKGPNRLNLRPFRDPHNPTAEIITPNPA